MEEDSKKLAFCLGGSKSSGHFQFLQKVIPLNLLIYPEIFSSLSSVEQILHL